jgi:hypothetical protein
VNNNQASAKKRLFEKLFGDKKIFSFSSKDGYGRTELLSHILAGIE